MNFLISVIYIIDRFIPVEDTDITQLYSSLEKNMD